MSLDTLLEAARYVELQEAQRLQTRVPEDRGLSPFVLTNGNSRYHDMINSPDFSKRAAGTREVHNKLEKNRRAHLKECFELLKKQLPPCTEDKKSSNLSILQIAIRFIQNLRRKEREFEREMERLAGEKIAYQQRLTLLKKDLSAQWEHIDFDKLLPDAHLIHDDPRHRDNVSRTSTASGFSGECDDTLSDHGRGEPLSKCGVLYSSTSSLSSAATACSPPQSNAHHPPPASNNNTGANAHYAHHGHAQHSQGQHLQRDNHGSAMSVHTSTPSPLNHSSYATAAPSNHARAAAVAATAPRKAQRATPHTGMQMNPNPVGMKTGTVLQSAHAPVSMAALHGNTVEAQTSASPAEMEGTKTVSASQHVQLPITVASHMVSGTGLGTTLVSPTIQLLTPAGLRVVSGDTQTLGLTTVAHRLRDASDIRSAGSITIPALQLANKVVGVTNGGIRNTKHQNITLTGVPNGLAGMTLTPITGHNLVTPMAVVSQGNQIAHHTHILASSGKMLKAMTMPPLVNGQYVVKPVVVVSSASAAPHNPSS